MADELDDLLDRALKSYSACEPLDGLEGRVLARVSDHIPSKVHWKWMATAAACLVIFAGAMGWRMLVVSAPARLQLSPVVVSESSSGSTEASVRLPVVRMPSRMSAHQPRHSGAGAVVRPHAMQLTREEVLLARFVASDQDQAVKQFASLHEYVQRDLTVEPLVVEPIKIGEIER